MSESLLEFRQVRKWFPITGGILQLTVGHVHAVDDVSLTVPRGRTVGLVGESGCGKSTLGRMGVKLLEPTRGEVFYRGQSLRKLGGRSLREFRRRVQIIFQDPYSSLNPRMTAGAVVAEGIAIHRLAPRRELLDRAAGYLERVGLTRDDLPRYPHEFSGGQRQRVGIARALAVQPELIVCDEPVSALDVSIQAQIIELLRDLQEEFGLSYLFVAHDLAVVRHISDRIAVMYLGKLCEEADKDLVCDEPLHPYTRALLSAAPEPDPTIPLEPLPLPGDVPSPINPPPGCRFAPRCTLATDRCSREEPVWREVRPDHWVACHEA
jgi:oligopeptide/dipeptide ABC transporter ATP-binding protein